MRRDRLHGKLIVVVGAQFEPLHRFGQKASVLSFGATKNPVAAFQPAILQSENCCLGTSLRLGPVFGIGVDLSNGGTIDFNGK